MSKDKERRASERLPVPKMLEVRLAAGNRACACLLRDLSPQGFQAESIRGDCFEPGETVEVTTCAPELASTLQGRACIIRWRKDRLFGADFGEDLPELITPLEEDRHNEEE